MSRLTVTATGYPDEFFDFVLGNAVLHHLDLPTVYREIHRVLRPGGVAVFAEPLRHNALVNLYRRLSPASRTRDELPLSYEDLYLAKRFFTKIAHREFYLTAPVAAALTPVSRRLTAALIRGLVRIDSLLFRIQRLRRYAWYTVIEMQR